MASITGVAEREAKPRANKTGTNHQPLVFKKTNIKIDEIDTITNKILFRPRRSLRVPLVSAPPIPANSQIESEAPATHKLAPSRLIKVGK